MEGWPTYYHSPCARCSHVQSCKDPMGKTLLPHSSCEETEGQRGWVGTPNPTEAQCILLAPNFQLDMIVSPQIWAEDAGPKCETRIWIPWVMISTESQSQSPWLPAESTGTPEGTLMLVWWKFPLNTTSSGGYKWHPRKSTFSVPLLL